MRDEFKETTREISKMVSEKVNKVMEDIRMMMERIMEHTKINIVRGQIEKENIIWTLITKEKRDGIILAIVIPIHHPINIIIGIQLQPIPMSLRLTFSLFTK